MTERTPSSVVLGRYLLFDEIGGGGMATVHLGRALGAAGFSRVVAIKRVHPERANDAQYATMLLDEARLASRIRHPNVVPTLDVVSVGSELVLVMDYVHGPSLSWLMRDLHRRGERAPVPVAARIVLDVLAGLHAAHEATSERGRPLEIVHRDVSPQNVLVARDGSSRIADFGIAKAHGKLSFTLRGQIRGKLSYMAPEQLRDEPLDRRVDVFATGIVLWELLTGHGLFRGIGGQGAAIEKLLLARIEPPSRHASIPEKLEAVVMTALQADRSERFETAEAMANALASSSEIASAKEVSAWVSVIAGELLATRSAMVERIEQISAVHEMAEPTVTLPEPPALPEPLAPPIAHPERSRRSSRVVVALAAITTFAIAVGVLAGVEKRFRRPHPTAATRAEASVAATTSSVADPPASAPPAAEPVSPASSASGPPSNAARSTTTVRAPSRSRKVAPPDCDPPFSIDSQGIRVPRRECLEP